MTIETNARFQILRTCKIYDTSEHGNIRIFLSHTDGPQKSIELYRLQRSVFRRSLRNPRKSVNRLRLSQPQTIRHDEKIGKNIGIALDKQFCSQGILSKRL